VYFLAVGVKLSKRCGIPGRRCLAVAAKAQLAGGKCLSGPEDCAHDQYMMIAIQQNSPSIDLESGS
jgi:hypothetical protein